MIRVLPRCVGCGAPRPIEAFERSHVGEIRVHSFGGRGHSVWTSQPLDSATAKVIYRRMRDAAEELREALIAAGVDPDVDDAAA